MHPLNPVHSILLFCQAALISEHLVDVAVKVNQMDVSTCLTNEFYLKINFLFIGKKP